MEYLSKIKSREKKQREKEKKSKMPWIIFFRVCVFVCVRLPVKRTMLNVCVLPINTPKRDGGRKKTNRHANDFAKVYLMFSFEANA